MQTEIDAPKLFLCQFEELDIFLPFRNVGFDKDRVTLAELSDDSFPLCGVHIDYCELPSLSCEIPSESSPNASKPQSAPMQNASEYRKLLR